MDDRSKFCEHFNGKKTISIENLIPNQNDFKNIIGVNEKIVNKSTLSFRVYDLPDIFDTPSKLMKELCQLPNNS